MVGMGRREEIERDKIMDFEVREGGGDGHVVG